jgi:cobalt-zinc-cadmium resistance protein CzcA
VEALLAKIPGVEYEFTQPIEMRFNELITGTRSDLAIKIFGEDLDLLYTTALEVEEAIKNIPGAADISVEKTAGLPQMSVKYDRSKLAALGINIADLNQIIATGFAGTSAGKIFEGERSFDLVLRFDEEHRNEINDIKNASIMAANGEHYPLSEFAEIKYAVGPAKISRDDTKRRIVIGVNVRNRDLESVVIDVQNTIATKVDLPAGYTVDYGGQFENLRTARQRLSIAVPIALLLIFFLLYFAFSSVKEALIIYSAIPLSAVGGILLLYIRDLPFSISAGVGFIALFGIAVLNGIVLIEEFKELKADGVIDMKERIIKGTQARLRPVLLTASAAALGFLPMAISTSAGAEVQRPLATVVVGGLISATLLTLIVYAIFDSKKIVLKKRRWKSSEIVLLALLITLLPLSGIAQNDSPSLNEAIAIALKNNHQLKASQLNSMERKNLIATAFNFEKTNVYYNFDENNIAPNNVALSVWGLQQNFSFPTIYGAQRGLKKEEWKEAQLEFTWQENRLEAAVSAAYIKVIYWQKQRDVASFIDSLYQKKARSAIVSFKAGESDFLSKITAESKAHHAKLSKEQALADLERARLDLQKLLQADSELIVPEQELPIFTIKLGDSLDKNPSIVLGMQRERIQQKQISLSRNKLLPDLQVEYFQGNNALTPTDIYQGFQAGVSIPLWFGAQSAQIRSEKIALQKITEQNENLIIEMRSERAQLFKEVYKWKLGIDHYEKEGKYISSNIIKYAEIAYQKGEINFIEYSLLLENAQEIKTTYLENLMAYNLSVLQLNYQLK